MINARYTLFLALSRTLALLLGELMRVSLFYVRFIFNNKRVNIKKMLEREYL